MNNPFDPEEMQEWIDRAREDGDAPTARCCAALHFLERALAEIKDLKKTAKTKSWVIWDE